MKTIITPELYQIQLDEQKRLDEKADQKNRQRMDEEIRVAKEWLRLKSDIAITSPIIHPYLPNEVPHNFHPNGTSSFFIEIDGYTPIEYSIDCIYKKQIQGNAGDAGDNYVYVARRLDSYGSIPFDIEKLSFSGFPFFSCSEIERIVLPDDVIDLDALVSGAKLAWNRRIGSMVGFSTLGEALIFSQKRYAEINPAKMVREAAEKQLASLVLEVRAPKNNTRVKGLENFLDMYVSDSSNITVRHLACLIAFHAVVSADAATDNFSDYTRLELLENTFADFYKD